MILRWDIEKTAVKRGSVLLLYTLLALTLLGIFSFVTFQPITVLPRITIAPGFSLANQDGERISSEDLRGRFTLYSFSYSGCAGCAQSPADITAVYNALSQKLAGGGNLQFVTLTVQPEIDSTTHLQKTAVLPNSQSQIKWHWLTGSPTQMRAVIGGGFDLYYKTQADGSIKFEPRYVLVDTQGMIRARYFDARPAVDLLLRDLGYLQTEVQDRANGNDLVYEAAHLFLCYPR